MSKKVMTIEEQWEYYAENVGLIKELVHPIQWLESKRAFFAGASSILINTNNVAELPTVVGVVKLQNWEEECKEFWNESNNNSL